MPLHKKIKIVHLLAYYGDYHGGIQVNVRELAKRQLQEGFDVKIMTSNLYGTQKEVDGVPIIRVKALFSAFRVPFTFALPYYLIKNDCDVLHVHIPLPWFDICSILKKIVHPKTKLIVSIHNYIPVNSFASAAFDFLHTNVLMNAILKFSDVVTISTREFGESLPYSLPENKLAVVPLGIDTKKFINGKTFNKNHVLFVGRLIPEKGLHVLMTAMKLVQKKNKHIKLLAICGENYDYKMYEKAIKKMDTGFLEIQKNIPNDKMPTYYQKAACFAMPSLDIDSFGIVLLESMACGCPVVVSNLAGPSAVAQYGNGIVVPKNNPKALAFGILSALKQKPSERKNMSDKIRKNFSWDSIYKQTMKAYSI